MTQLPINFSLVKLFNTVFRAVPQFEPNLEELPSRRENNSLGTPYYSIDQFGREVFLPITLRYTTDEGAQISLSMYHAVIGIRGSDEEVRTKLTERNGTFSELITGNDWVFDVKGFLIEGTNDFPEAQFKDLIALKKARQVVSLENAMTDLVLIDADGGTDTVTITDIDFPPVIGVQNVKPFTMTLTSSTDFNLYEIE